jgi:hypothetical protein
VNRIIQVQIHSKTLETFYILLVWAAPTWIFAEEPVAIGSRLKLFTDGHLIDSLQGGAGF